MEVFIAPIKLKQEVSIVDLSQLEILTSDDVLISTNIVLDLETSYVICEFLLKLTNHAIKASRAIHVPIAPAETGPLYCVPVKSQSKSLKVKSNHKLKFSPFLSWVGLNHKNKTTFDQASRLLKWLERKKTSSGCLELIFSSSSDDRFKWSITNPGLSEESNQLASFHQLESPSSSSSLSLSPLKPQQIQTLLNMVLCDKCDMFKNNPLFGSNLSFKHKVDRLVTNDKWVGHRFFHLSPSNSSSNYIVYDIFSSRNKEKNIEDFRQLLDLNENSSGFEDCPSNSINKNSSLNSSSTHGFLTSSLKKKNIQSCFPLHNSVISNNIDEVKNCIARGHSIIEYDNYNDTPLHLAAEHGRVEMVEYMLTKTSTPIDVSNRYGQTLLHIAVMNHQMDMLQWLLDKEVNVYIKDKQQKTALEYCYDYKFQEAIKILKKALEQPLGMIEVHLMDISVKRLVLPSGANTTVEQLHRLVMQELKLPLEYLDLFAIWICSRNLQLQLREEHRPIQQLNDWKTKIVPKMTDQPPDLDDPRVYFRRNALLHLAKENEITNKVVINFLFLEAYHNYIKSLYLCNQSDVIFLSGIIMQLFNGNYDDSRKYFDEDRLLENLVPGHMMKEDCRKGWIKKILAQYKTYSSKLSEKTNAIWIHQLCFLRTCRTLTTYGSAFFTGYEKSRNGCIKIFIGVNDFGCQVICVFPREMRKCFKYPEISWMVDGEEELVIRKQGRTRGVYVIISKQASLINSIMDRLSKNT